MRILGLVAVSLVTASADTDDDSAMFRGTPDHAGVYAARSAPALGSVRWKYKTGGRVLSTPLAVNDAVYFGSTDGSLYALNSGDGSLRWKFPTRGPVNSSPAFSNGVVYAGSVDGSFYAVDAKTGAAKWKHDNKMGWVIASPAVKDGIVYFPTSDGTRFKAIDGASGELKYSIENKAVSFSSPAIVNDRVYFGSSDGWLHALELGTGAIKAQFQTDGSKEFSPRYVDANGKIKSAELYTERTHDAMVIGLNRMFSLGSILSSPVISPDGTLYVGSTDGHVYALR